MPRTRRPTAIRTRGYSESSSGFQTDQGRAPSPSAAPPWCMQDGAATTPSRKRPNGRSPAGAPPVPWYAPAPWPRQNAVAFALAARRRTTAVVPTRAAASNSRSSQFDVWGFCASWGALRAPAVRRPACSVQHAVKSQRREDPSASCKLIPNPPQRTTGPRRALLFKLEEAPSCRRLRRSCPSRAVPAPHPSSK